MQNITGKRFSKRRQIIRFAIFQIKRLGPGTHGPIRFAPHHDWRLALALNPVFINVRSDTIRIGHPRLVFAAPDAPPVHTIVPIGKMRIRVYDNLVGALQPKPFAAYAQWKPDFLPARQ